MEETPQKKGAPGELRIQLLGGFSVAIAGDPILAKQWRLRKVRSLVKLLALAPAHRLHRDQVIDTLWPDADLSAAANSFYQALSNARRILRPAGERCLELEEGWLSLSSAGLVIDAEQFAEAAIRAKGSRHPVDYQAALDYYTGDLLPDDRYEDWTAQPREALRQTYLELVLMLARLHEENRAYPAAIAALLRLLAADPSHEGVHIGLMRLYALSGQRQQALRQYQALRDALRAELDVEPGPDTEQLYEAIQSGRFLPPESMPAIPPLLEYRPVSTPGAPPTETVPNNLPAQLTSFIGRTAEIDRVRDLLQANRLVTLTGSGGVGKTRLALQVAASVLDMFPNGAWLIELAALADPEMVALSVAYGLGMRDTPRQNTPDILASYLRDKHLLLILDNCEHLIEACARLAERLLQACPRLVILATSREALGIGGETAFRLPSLDFPDPQQLPPPDALAQMESVRLFVERASAVQPTFALTGANAPAVAQICRRLDGIPLAIELAAARTRMLTVDQIAARLDDAFRLLTGGSRTALPRQQTLKAAIDWSYHLLPGQEKLLLDRLSVFAGGWTLEAAEQVCSDPEDRHDPLVRPDSPVKNTADTKNMLDQGNILDPLGRLVDKSLVSLEINETGAGRYHMLETVRQYAHAALEEREASQNLRDRHLEYFRQLALQAEPHLRGLGGAQWLDRLEEELDNLRVALEWGVTGRVVDCLQLVNALFWFFHIHGHSAEGIQWYQNLLAGEASLPAEASETFPHRVFASPRLSISPSPPPRRLARARGLLRLCFLATTHHNDYPIEQGRTDIEESVAILRELGPAVSRDLATALIYQSFLLFFLPDAAQAAATFQEGLELAMKTGDKFLISECLRVEGDITSERGDEAHQEALKEEILVLRRAVGDEDGMGSSLYGLGSYALFRGAYARAAELFDESLVHVQAVKNQWSLGFLYLYRSILAHAQGDYPQATRWGEDGMAAYRALDEKYFVLLCMYELGMAAWSAGEYSLAAWQGNELLALAEELGPHAPVHLADHLLGRAALSQGEIVTAQRHFKKMLMEYADYKVDFQIPPASTPDDPLNLSYLLESLAMLASAQGP